MKRNIRVHNQTKIGAGGWVVFYGVSDIPSPIPRAGRVGMDLDNYPQARRAANALKAIPDSEWNYDNAWDVGWSAAYGQDRVRISQS